MVRATQPRPSEELTRQVVETTIREQFTLEEAPTIDIKFIEDDDESEWIEILIVYAHVEPPASKILPIGGFVRRRLLAIGETAFPLVSFASETDYASLHEIEVDL